MPSAPMRSAIFSLIIPSFQQVEFVGQCIESALSELQDEDQIMVFDAGSSDGSVEILEAYRSRLTSLCVGPDLGQAHAINKGLSRASGEIICYLNSDDILLPRSLEIVDRYFQANPQVDLVYGKAHYIDRQGIVLRDYLAYDWNEARFLEECFICQPATFWRARVIKKIGLLDEKLHCSMDYDYWIRAARAGCKIAFIDEYLACSREYPETKTKRDRNKVYRENFRLMLKRLGYVPAHWIEGYLQLIKYHNKPKFASILPGASRGRQWLAWLLELLSRCFARDVYLVDERRYMRVI